MAQPKRARQPWASGPGEILQHGIGLLQEDSDRNRRLGILSIDNAVELMIKTYLGLPKRVNGLPISRATFAEMCESFPKLLDALEEHCEEKLDGIDLSEIEWYHRLRNELYHQGNGLTVEREKVEVYAELAQLLFSRLFGFELEIRKPNSTVLIGQFMKSWSEVESHLQKIASVTSPQRVGRGPMMLLQQVRDKIPAQLFADLLSLREIRNRVVHGHGSSEVVEPEQLKRLMAAERELAKIVVTINSLAEASPRI